MKKIIENYTSALIAMIVALGIFGIFYGYSFGNDLTFSSSLKKIFTSAIFTDVSTLKTGNTFDIYANQTLLNFTICNYEEIQIGEAVPISSIVKAVDADGKEWDVGIKNVWDENFQSTNSLEILEQKHLYFHDVGVFWVELYPLNQKEYNHRAIVRIFANER